jgi:hypothetical protein
VGEGLDARTKAIAQLKKKRNLVAVANLTRDGRA